MEWRCKVEAGEEEDEEDVGGRGVDGGGRQDSRSVDEKEVGGRDSEWVDEMEEEEENDDDSGWVDEEEENGDECLDEAETNEEVGADRRLAHSISEIKRLWGEGYWRQLAEVEKKAEEKETEYKEFLGRR